MAAAFRVESPEIVGCGRPRGGATVAIVDPATGLECAPARSARSGFTGDNVAAGYWENPRPANGSAHVWR